MISLRSDERGLSLIETLAALSIFAVITIGITPLLGSSLRASALSRSYTQGKDIALQAMERVRGLPYYVSYQSQNKKVDVLDLYFPCSDPTLAATGCAGEGARTYTAATGVFTVTCTTATPGPSCAVPLIPGYSLRFEARFVRGDGSTVEIPPSTYRRNPGATQGAIDAPPSQLLELRVVALWDVQGSQRSQTLTSLIGARKFGPIKMAGLARVSYGAQVLTSYAHNSGDTRVSDLKAIAGISESQFQTRLVSTARQSVRGSEISLIRRPTETDTEAVHLGGSPVQGVVAEVDAPPNQAPVVAPSPAAPGTSFNHPNVSSGNPIAFMNTSSASSVTANTSNELPSAGGTVTIQATSLTSDTALGYFWVNNQVDFLQNTLLRIDSGQKVFSLKTQASTTMQGQTSISSTALGATRQVRSQSSLSIKLVRAMPVSFLSGANDERQIIVIKNFTASLDCTSKGGPTSTATGSWSAKFKLWRDPDDDGSANLILGTNGDASATEIDLSGDLSADESPSVKTILQDVHGIPNGNPLLWDGVGSLTDVYLFDTATTEGYITDFTINPVIAETELDGDLSRASIDGAIHISTVPTNPNLPESGLNISIGSLSCEALDQR